MTSYLIMNTNNQSPNHKSNSPCDCTEGEVFNYHECTNYPDQVSVLSQ